MLVLLIGGIVWCIMGVVIATKVFGAKLSTVLMLLYAVLFAVVLCLDLWIGSKLVGGAAGKIEIGGRSVSGMMGDISSQFGSFGGLFG